MDFGLSHQQLAVICALSSGATAIAAAEQAGIHRNTISNWRRNSPPFQEALAHAQYDRALFFREQAEDRAGRAFKTIDEILNDPKAPASVRLKAALAIIQIAINPPAPKKQIEFDIELVAKQSPPQAVTQDQTVTQDQPAPVPPEPADRLHHDAPSAEPTIVHKGAQPGGPTTMHNEANPGPVNNPAQPAPPPPQPQSAVNPRPVVLEKPHIPAQQPYRRPEPKVGRNEPCPCGSGQKFKKCCLDKPPFAAAA